jgi:hypothetical protein
MVARLDGWSRGEFVRRDREWTVEDLAVEVPALFGDQPLVRPVQGSPFD